MSAVKLTAPANRLLTVLHVIDPAAQWVEDPKGYGSTNGTTMCGLSMYLAENWQLVEQMPGETLCVRCTGEGVPDEQGTLL